MRTNIISKNVFLFAKTIACTIFCALIFLIPSKTNGDILIKGTADNALKDAVKAKLSHLTPLEGESYELLIISVNSAPEMISLGSKGDLQFSYGSRTAKFLIEIKEQGKIVFAEIAEVTFDTDKDCAATIAQEAEKIIRAFRN